MRIKKLKYIGAIMILPVLGVVIFQVLWVMDTYKINKQHFEKDISEALNSAIRDDIVKDVKPIYTFSRPKESDSCMVPDSTHKMDLVKMLKDDASSLKIRINARDTNHKIINSSTISLGGNEESDSELVTESTMQDTIVPSESVQDSLKGLMSDAFVKVLSSVYGDRIQLSSLDTFFRKELNEKGIEVDYVIALYENDSIIACTDSTITSLSLDLPTAKLGENRSLRVFSSTKAQFLISSLWLNILGSIFLVIVVIGSFLYMLSIIFKQKRLSNIKNDFISNLTHEFKTPIAIVTAAVEAMQSFGVSDDVQRRKKYLNISLKELHRLNEMVESVLNISTVENNNEETEIEVFDLSDLVAETANRYLMVHQDKLSIIENYSDQVWVKANRSEINSVINNLIDNAIKYSNNNTRLNISCIINKTKVELRIKDYGIGIPKEHQKKVFDKFYRVPDEDTTSVRGFGLGLSYVKDVINKHMGTILLKSEKDIGSEFIVILPLANGSY